MNYNNHIRFIQSMGVMFALALTFKFVGAIPQDLSYHNFADRRCFFSICNFFDVFTNFAFFVPSILGIQFTIKKWNDNELFSCSFERWIRLIFFATIFLVAFGSAYYHINPNNKTLIWDRLPMAIGFMAIFTIIISIYIDRSRKKIKVIFILLQFVGVFSVLYWAYTESLGIGDLRLYALVQYLPLIIIPIIVALNYKNNNSETKVVYILLTLIFYIIAKILEIGDNFIFELLGNIISGHSLKHIFSATAVFYIHKFCSSSKHIK